MTKLLAVFKEHTDIVWEPENLENHLNITKKLEPTEWSKVIIKAAVSFLKETHANEVDKVEAKYSRTMYKVIKDFINPFSILNLAAETITKDQFFDCLMRHDPNTDKVILDFVPEAEFTDAIDRANEIFQAFELKKQVDIKSIKTPKGLDEKTKMILDSVLSGNEWPTTDEIIAVYDKIGQAKDALDKASAENAGLIKEMEALQAKLAEAALRSYQPVEVEEVSGEIPAGKTVRKMVSEVFPDIAWDKDFEVTAWEWEGVHPMVPKADASYIFRPELVTRVLYALETNQRAYLQGHTGTGKTTLIEQVASRLGYPTMRINFDSEISRMDLIGRDTLKDGESKFVDGMLPTMMSQPCIGIFDELDFCRPDVAYVMQSALENNSLRITEDGGREVKPHPMFRMFGTGNTVGQGDEAGMYQGARPQSLAFLDRFTIWMKVDYLTEEERTNLIQRHNPSLKKEITQQISKYVTEHIAAFTDAKVLQPISPRGMLAVAKAVTYLTAIGNKKPLKDALTMTVLDRATNSDGAVLKGIIDRVAK